MRTEYGSKGYQFLVLIAFTGVLISNPARGQQLRFPDGLSQEAREAWTGFTDKYGRDKAVEWNMATGTPHMIRGRGIPLASVLPALDQTPESINLVERVTRSFLAENKSLFRLEDKDLKLSSIDYDEPSEPEHIQGTWYVLYNQYYGRIPVYGATIRFIIKNGILVSIRFNSFPQIDLDVTPVIPVETSVDIALEDLGVSNYVDPVASDLYIYPLDENGMVRFNLVWKILFPLTEDPLGAWQFFVDCKDGTIIRKTNEFRYESLSGNVTGKIYPETPNDIQVTVDFDHNTVIAKQGGQQVGSAETDHNGDYEITGLSGTVTVESELKGPYVDVDNEDAAAAQHTSGSISVPGIHSWGWESDDASSGDQESNAFYHMNLIHDFFTSGDPFNITSMNYQMVATVNYSNQYCNAGYALGNILFFGGNGSNIDSMALFSDVIYHEYTHGVIDHIYSGNPDIPDPPNAVHEGISDYYACTLNNNSCIDFDTDCGSGACLRDLDNSERYPCSGQDYYAHSLILSGALWDLRQDKGAALTDALTIKSLKAHTMSGISFSCLSPGFTPFLEDMLDQDDNDGDLYNGTPNSTNICTAFLTLHGITSPYCAFDDPEKFYVKNSSGNKVAFFGSEGNLVLEGDLTEENTTVNPGASSEIIVKDSGGSPIVFIDSTNGNIYIDGNVFDNQPSLIPGAGYDLIIKNSNGDVVCFIDENGNLYLRGYVYTSTTIPD